MITCRGCGKELENCTCDVLTTKKEQTEKLKLIEIYDPCIPCEKEHNGECFDIECTTHSYERGFKDGTVDQKALDDKEKEEAIRKVFDWIDKNIGDSYDMRLPVGSYEAFKKKTLEELK